jgi:RNase adapter protein RapZ
MSAPQLVIISGLSGAGKSTALKTLEDAGYYCIDNLPSQLFPSLIDLFQSDTTLKKHHKLALSMDAREKGFIDNFNKHYDDFKKNKAKIKTIYLDTDDNVLIQRFSSTRRRHPLSPRGNIHLGIRKERTLLAPICDMANYIIDTSNLNVHQLKKQILRVVQVSSQQQSLNITLLSFGYHFGVPHHADIVMDVRFVANPYFIPHLKDLTGRDKKVQDYVLKQKVSQTFLRRFKNLLNFLISEYETEGKAYLTIAMGCTGGRHRSVSFSEIIAKQLKKKGHTINLVHRDLSLS